MTKQPSQLCMMFGGAAIITLSRCGPHLAASVLEQQGWGERSTGCFLALNWNKVTQQWPEVSFIIVATRASSQYVRALPSTYKRTKSSHCSITAPVSTLKWNEIKRGWEVERFLILFSDAVCKKTGYCKCEISHRAQRDAESQMAVDASSFRSAVNSNSLAILLQGSGHFQIALSPCIGVCGTLKWFFSSVLHLWEYLLLLRLLVMPSRLQSLPLWSLLFSLLVFTCGSNGSYFALCFWQTPVFWNYYVYYQEKYPGHYCAGLLMWSWFKLWSNPANHLSLSLLYFFIMSLPLPLFIQGFLFTHLYPHCLLFVLFIIYFSGYLNSSTWLPQIIPPVVITFYLLQTQFFVTSYYQLPASHFFILLPTTYIYSSGHTGRKEEVKLKLCSNGKWAWRTCLRSVFTMQGLHQLFAVAPGGVNAMHHLHWWDACHSDRLCHRAMPIERAKGR